MWPHNSTLSVPFANKYGVAAVATVCGVRVISVVPAARCFYRYITVFCHCGVTRYGTDRNRHYRNNSETISWSSDITAQIEIPIVTPVEIWTVCIESQLNMYAANQFLRLSTCGDEAMKRE